MEEAERLPQQQQRLQRLQRPEPERIEPIRGFGEYASHPAAPAPEVESATGSDAETKPAADDDTQGARSEGASGAVNLGYRVIDEYIRQGQRAAQRLGLGTAAGLGSGSFQGLSERLLRDGLLWLEHLAKIWSTLDPQPPRHSERPRGGATTAPGPVGSSDAIQTANIRVEVASRAPTEVFLELRPSALDRRLGVQGLRSSGDGELRGCRLTGGSSGQPFRVSVRVPDGQAPGLYSGIVFDIEDDSIQGTLSVCVSAEDA